MSRPRAFSRALRQLSVFASYFDWIAELSVYFVIAWCDNFGFDFTNFN